MTDPLVALGLDPGADERAVKRAYARLLRAARPDADPAGFQALRYAYEGALARVRARGGAGREALPEDETPPSRPTSRPPPSPLPPDAADTAGAPGVEPFAVDLDLLVALLLARAAQDTPDGLRSWIAAETASWPLAAKPALAPHLLAALAADDVDLAPGQFDAVAEAFGFDDVALGLDALLLSAVRARLDGRRRAADVAALMRPDRRRTLCRHMARREAGGYHGIDTRLMAAILTGPGALGRARALQFVPLLPGGVWYFLKHVDGGRTDALSPGIRPEVVEVWRRADRRRAAFKPYRRWAAIIVALVIVLAAVAVNGSSSVPPDGAAPVRPSDRALLDEGRDEAAAGRHDAAVATFTTLVARHPPPVPRDAEMSVALAYRGMASALARSGWNQEARAAYRDLDAALSRSSDPAVELLVAESLGDLGDLDRAAGLLAPAGDAYAAVVSRYGTAFAPDLRAQVVRALAGAARAASGRLHFGEAMAACADARARMEPGTPVATVADVDSACGSLPR